MSFLSKLRQSVGRRLGRSSPHERFLRRLDCPAEKAAEMYRQLAENDITAWVVGGWGVDAVAGRQTRPHQDLDLLVPVEDGDRARLVLEEQGFKFYPPETQLPYHVAMVNKRGRLMVDLQFLSMEPDGSGSLRGIHPHEEAPNFEYLYSAEGLGGRGTIAGAEVRCITLQEQVRARTEQPYSFENPDRLRKDGILADVHDLALVEKLLDS